MLIYHFPMFPNSDIILAISLAKNPIFHARTKHVEIEYYYIKDKVLSHEVDVHFVCSQD